MDLTERKNEQNKAYPYGAVMGSYQPLFSELPLERDKSDGLYGTELIIADHIASLLADRRREHPVVFLDFGGMFSLTSARLAKNFADAIKESRLALVVTNLTFTRHDLLSKIDACVGFQEHSPLRSLYLAQQSNIHFITGGAVSLHRQSILLPDGNVVTLLGNVDGLIERNTVGFSWKPEIDMAFLGDLLSPDGLFLSGTGGPQFNGYNLDDDADAFVLWYLAHDNGLSYLQARGLRELNFTRSDAAYRVFLGPNAFVPARLRDYLIEKK